MNYSIIFVSKSYFEKIGFWFDVYCMMESRGCSWQLYCYYCYCFDHSYRLNLFSLSYIFIFYLQIGVDFHYLTIWNSFVCFAVFVLLFCFILFKNSKNYYLFLENETIYFMKDLIMEGKLKNYFYLVYAVNEICVITACF